MKLVERGWQRRCPECGFPGAMFLEEPDNDASGAESSWVRATGCWQVENGKLIHKCAAPTRQDRQAAATT